MGVKVGDMVGTKVVDVGLGEELRGAEEGTVVGEEIGDGEEATGVRMCKGVCGGALLEKEDVVGAHGIGVGSR